MYTLYTNNQQSEPDKVPLKAESPEKVVSKLDDAKGKAMQHDGLDVHKLDNIR